MVPAPERESFQLSSLAHWPFVFLPPIDHLFLAEKGWKERHYIRRRNKGGTKAARAKLKSSQGKSFLTIRSMAFCHLKLQDASIKLFFSLKMVFDHIERVFTNSARWRCKKKGNYLTLFILRVGGSAEKKCFFPFFGNRNKFEFKPPPPTLEMKVERDRILVGQSWCL